MHGDLRLRVMTFNIRFQNAVDDAKGHGWNDRLPSVLETVRRLQPGAVGFQEARRQQLDDLTEALPEYRSVGQPREAGEAGEYVPVFYDTGRFDRVDAGDFWLSASPDEPGSLGWDAPDPRHCTWIVLGDRAHDREFALFNTHLDVWGSAARMESARLIVQRMQLASGVPYVVLGDFNAGEDSEPLDVFRAAGLRDTFRICHPDATDVGTVHHWEQPVTSEKIDFVMCDASWIVEGADIERRPAAGRLPSDHFPVVADLVLPAS